MSRQRNRPSQPRLRRPCASGQRQVKGGLFSSGGLSITLGKQQQSTDQQNTATGAAASTVGAVAGDVNIVAGQNYTQTGSDLIAPQGDINVLAQDIAILDARTSQVSQTEQKSRQSGLTLAITSPVISAVQTVQGMAQAAGQTSDGRMQALAAGSAALAAKSAVDAVAANPGQAGGINLSISIGGSQSQSNTVQSSSTAAGSTVAAGGDIKLSATGAGKDSDIAVQGSTVKAANNATLKADGDINLLAAKNTAEQHSTNKNSSASIGVSIGTDGLLFTASASGGRGRADGNDVNWTNTRVEAGNQLTLESGGDTTLKGAVVTGKQVQADIGGNLDIASLQDTSQYQSKQQSLGGSITVGASVAGSISASKSKIDSNFASVAEQAGIQAGDGGFQVNVAGNTDLKGAVIASSQAAVEQNLNRFQTGGQLTTSDIQNTASYSAKAAGLTLGAGTSLDGKLAPQGSGAGIGKDSGNAASTTQSGISGSAGNQAARTGDAQTGIQKIFDADKVQKEINAQVVITQSFGQQAGKAVGDYVQEQKQTLREAYKNAAAADRAAIQARFDDLILQERAMNVLIGAVAGLSGSALAKETLALAADEMHRISVEDSMKTPSIVDAYGKTISNLRPGEENKLRQDIDLAGTRADPDGICGKANERCKKQEDASGQFILDEKGIPKLEFNSKGQTQFDEKDANNIPISLDAFFASPEGKKMEGITGGIQGWTPTFAGYEYPAGGVIDRVFRAFAGTHDVIGGQLPGFYDEQGNRRRGMTKAETTANETWSAVAIVPSAPFAMATLLPPEVWKAISILLGAAK